jgi:hypothetical protein
MYEVGELGASEVGQLAELPASIYTR